jgi:HEAT repeat protein
MNMREDGDDKSPAEMRHPAALHTKFAFFRNSVLVVVAAGTCVLIAVWLLREPVASQSPAESGVPRALRSGDPGTRTQALRDIAQSGMADCAKSIPAVVEAMSDAEWSVRAEAAQSLGMLGSYAVWAKMSGVASAGSDDEPLNAASKALLTALANDGDSAVRAAAAGSLGNIAATSPRPPTSKGASKKGGKGSATAPVKSPVDYNAIVAALITALGDQDDAVRAAAAAAMGAAGPKVSPEPPPQLVAALKDPSAVTRAAAGAALPGFERGLDPILPTLIRLARENDPTVHQACVGALNKIKKTAISPAAVPALIEGLDNPDKQVRIQAISLLARFGQAAKDAVPRLIAVLDEPLASDGTTMGGGRSALVRFTGPAHEAAKALGEIVPGSPLADTSVAALSRVVRGEARQRRASAADALGKFGAAAAPAIPDLVKMLEQANDGQSRTASIDAEAASSALGQIAADASTTKTVLIALKEALHSGPKTSRVAVIEAIGELGTKAATAAPEIEALKNDPDPNVQKAATEALHALGR